MDIIDELFGTPEQTSVIEPPDQVDVDIDSLDDNSAELKSQEVYLENSSLQDLSGLGDTSKYLLPFDVQISDPSDVGHTGELSRLGVAIQEAEKLAGVGARKTLSLAGKGVKLLGDIMTGLNKAVTNSNAGQVFVGSLEQVADKRNLAMQRTAEWYAMVATNGGMPKDEAMEYTESLIDRSKKPKSLKGIVLNLTSMLTPGSPIKTKATSANPTEWKTLGEELSEVPFPLFDILKGTDHDLSLICFPGADDFPAAADDRFLTRVCHVCDGTVLCPAVILIEDDGSVQVIRPAAYHHSHRSGKWLPRLHPAYGIFSFRERSKRAVGLFRVRC